MLPSTYRNEDRGETMFNFHKYAYILALNSTLDPTLSCARSLIKQVIYPGVYSWES